MIIPTVPRNNVKDGGLERNMYIMCVITAEQWWIFLDFKRPFEYSFLDKCGYVDKESGMTSRLSDMYLVVISCFHSTILRLKT